MMLMLQSQSDEAKAILRSMISAGEFVVSSQEQLSAIDFMNKYSSANGYRAFIVNTEGRCTFSVDEALYTVKAALDQNLPPD